MNNDTVLLDTGLFRDREILLAAIEHLELTDSNKLILIPNQMNDGDWDNVLSRLLSAKRVITV